MKQSCWATWRGLDYWESGAISSTLSAVLLYAGWSWLKRHDELRDSLHGIVGTASFRQNRNKSKLAG